MLSTVKEVMQNNSVMFIKESHTYPKKRTPKWVWKVLQENSKNGDNRARMFPREICGRAESERKSKTGGQDGAMVGQG